MDINHSKTTQAARVAAIEYLSYGAKTSGKIIQKLKDKGYDNDTIKEVVQELASDAYIKDEAIMEAYWLRRTGTQRESIAAFCIRMAKLGVNRKFIENFKLKRPPERYDPLLVREYLSAKYERELAYLRQGDLLDVEKRELIQKIARNCGTRGFRYALVLDGLRACAILIQE